MDEGSVAMSGSVREQADAVTALRAAYAREADGRGRLAAAIAVTGAALAHARDVGVPWRQCQQALGGVNRAAANARWKTFRDRAAGAGGGETNAAAGGVLSEMADRWGGERPLRELQALEVAAELGAHQAAEHERVTCLAESGRRDYEIDDLVARTLDDAAEAGRLALVRASRTRIVPTLEAWQIVVAAASAHRPLWRGNHT